MRGAETIQFSTFQVSVDSISYTGKSTHPLELLFDSSHFHVCMSLSRLVQCNTRKRDNAGMQEASQQ